MVVTGNLVAQWAAILIGFIYFLWRQGNDSGAYAEGLRSLTKTVIDLKNSIDDDMASMRIRVEQTENRLNASGDDRLMSWGQHDKVQVDCQRRLLEKIQLNADVFERVADRMDKMDDRRESQRDRDDDRLRKIEQSMATMTESLKHLAAVIDRREPKEISK